MSVSKDLYWKNLNQMLKNDEIEFNQVAELKRDSTTLILNVKSEQLKKGVQFALDNFNEIAKLEYEFNDGQPAKITLKHLQWAKVYIENNKSVSKQVNSSALIAHSLVSVGQFLLDCYAATQQDSMEFTIYTDTKRKSLITCLFGNEFTEERSALTSMRDPLRASDISCTKFIFDSGDVASAIDKLIMNVSDRTSAPWRIRSVYVQESLKHRLNAAKNIIGRPVTEENQKKSEELAKRFGGKFISGNNLLFDVPPKYLPEPTEMDFDQIPVAINFFRTTKEAYQLANGDSKSDSQPGVRQIASIWTENIDIYYEVAAELNAEIIWSNSVGEFDKIMPSLNTPTNSKQITRFEINSNYPIICALIFVLF